MLQRTWLVSERALQPQPQNNENKNFSVHRNRYTQLLHPLFCLLKKEVLGFLFRDYGSRRKLLSDSTRNQLTKRQIKQQSETLSDRRKSYHREAFFIASKGRKLSVIMDTFSNRKSTNVLRNKAQRTLTMSTKVLLYFPLRHLGKLYHICSKSKLFFFLVFTQ